MKKITTLVLLICILLTVAGCSVPQLENPNSTPATKDDADKLTDNIGPIKQIPIVSVSVPMAKDTYYAEDKTALLNCVYQNISLITPDAEVADRVIIDFLNETDIDNSAKSFAEEHYKETPESFNPYLTQIIYNPMRVDQGVLSFFGAYVSYTGGVHAETVGSSITYDLITGQKLTLKDILLETATPESINDLVIKYLSSDADLYANYKQIIKDRFDKNFLSDSNWYLSSTGLCFHFSPYEIGPYASGLIVAEIPYSALTGLMNDAYFPAERETATGTVDISKFDMSAVTRFSQTAEVVIEKDTDTILLQSEKGVYDIRIEVGSWSADGQNFIPEYTAFASYALSPGDAIIVEAPISETLSTLRLSYTSNNKTVSTYIGADTIR